MLASNESAIATPFFVFALLLFPLFFHFLCFHLIFILFQGSGSGCVTQWTILCVSNSVFSLNMFIRLVFPISVFPLNVFPFLMFPLIVFIFLVFPFCIFPLFYSA